MNEDDRIEDALAAYKAKIARLGGIARAKRLSAARRKEIATKASKAAAKARTRKAKKKH
jgi:ribosomal protein S21